MRIEPGGGVFPVGLARSVCRSTVSSNATSVVVCSRMKMARSTAPYAGRPCGARWHASHAKSFRLVRRLLKEHKFLRPRERQRKEGQTETK